MACALFSLCRTVLVRLVVSFFAACLAMVIVVVVVVAGRLIIVVVDVEVIASRLVPLLRTM